MSFTFSGLQQFRAKSVPNARLCEASFRSFSDRGGNCQSLVTLEPLGEGPHAMWGVLKDRVI